MIELEVRRSLKEFGKGGLIKSGFYRINRRSFVRGGLIRLEYLWDESSFVRGARRYSRAHQIFNYKLIISRILQHTLKKIEII